MPQRVTRTVGRSALSGSLIAVAALATCAGLVGATQSADAGTPLAAAPGISCEHVIGTTGGVVTLSACRSRGQLAGNGTVPGKVFIPGTKRIGVIHWTSGNHSYSTTASITTSPDSSGEYCARHGYKGEYVVKGRVTANTDPDIAVGQSVYSVVCISSSGAVKQTHYGYLDV